MPPAIRQLGPEWGECSLAYFGLDDPPIALKSTGNFLSSSASVPAVPVTTPNDPPRPSATQATPADPPSPPTSAPTARPPTPSNEPPSDPPNDPPSDPEDPEDPPSNPEEPPTDPEQPPSNPQDPPTDPGNPPVNPPSNPTRPGISPSFGQPAPTHDPNRPPGNPNSPPSNNPGPITITNAPGGPIVADPTGGIILNPGTTIRPGDPPLVISDTTISAAPTGIVIVGPSGTQTVPFPSAGPGGVTITAGGSTFTADPSGIIVAPGTTIRPGGSEVVISDTTFSAVPTGIVIIGPSGTQTIPIPIQTGSPEQITITAGGETLVAGPSGIVVAPGTTLQQGDAPVTIDGTTISMGPSGVVVVNPDGVTNTVALPTGSGSSTVTLTLGNGEVVTATSANGVVVMGSVTLTVGGTATTLPGGQIISLGSSGVVFGTGTTASTAVLTGSGSDSSPRETGAFPGKAAGGVGMRWAHLVGGLVLGIAMGRDAM